MKKTHIVLILILTLAMLSAGAVSIFAESYQYSGDCTFDGSAIHSDFDSDGFASAFSGLEPGDQLQYTITYKNNGKNATDWYLKNSVLETLEASKASAQNAGYTYILQNVSPDGTVTDLFNSSEVGGENTAGGLQGLKQATNATGEFFFIQTLAPGESGRTNLRVAIDGESAVNSYMETSGSLMAAYAVEEMVKGTTIVQEPDGQDSEITKTVSKGSAKTGDPFGLLKAVLLLTAAVLAAFFAFFSWRRDRREAEREGGEGV